MASSVVIPVVRLKNVREHPYASFLGLADVLGYQVAIQLIEDPNGKIVRRLVRGKTDKNGRRIEATPEDTDVETVRYRFKYEEDEKVVYFPANTVISDEWIDRFGVRNLLIGKQKNRVGKIKLRGEPSFGLVVSLPDGVEWEEGYNAAEYFGAKKYEPPVKQHMEDAAKYDNNIDPYFQKYTDIENGLIFTDIFDEGEEVVVTEKIHGTNSRIGVINGVRVAGSMELRRSPPVNKSYAESVYWFPWSIPEVERLVDKLTTMGNHVQLFGEIYGGNIQSLHYGIPKGRGLGYRAFDILIDGKYLDWDRFYKLCQEYKVETVPILWRGPFSLKKIEELKEGRTTIGDHHIREGVVVKPTKERTHHKIGRVILKYISFEYEFSKHKDKEAKDQ